MVAENAPACSRVARGNPAHGTLTRPSSAHHAAGPGCGHGRPNVLPPSGVRRRAAPRGPGLGRRRGDPRRGRRSAQRRSHDGRRLRARGGQPGGVGGRRAPSAHAGGGPGGRGPERGAGPRLGGDPHSGVAPGGEPERTGDSRPAGHRVRRTRAGGGRPGGRRRRPPAVGRRDAVAARRRRGRRARRRPGRAGPGRGPRPRRRGPRPRGGHRCTDRGSRTCGRRRGRRRRARGFTR